MDRQFVYDVVRDHLLNQNAKSISSDPSIGCAYRGEAGKTCAIGCLVPDELYKREYEGKAIADLPRSILRYLGADSEGGRGFLEELQGIHDDIDPTDWDVAFYQFALDRGLRP